MAFTPAWASKKRPMHQGAARWGSGGGSGSGSGSGNGSELGAPLAPPSRLAPAGDLTTPNAMLTVPSSSAVVSRLPASGLSRSVVRAPSQLLPERKVLGLASDDPHLRSLIPFVPRDGRRGEGLGTFPNPGAARLALAKAASARAGSGGDARSTFPLAADDGDGRPIHADECAASSSSASLPQPAPPPPPPPPRLLGSAAAPSSRSTLPAWVHKKPRTAAPPPPPPPPANADANAAQVAEYASDADMVAVEVEEQEDTSAADPTPKAAATGARSKPMGKVLGGFMPRRPAPPSSHHLLAFKKPRTLPTDRMSSGRGSVEL